MVKISHKDVFSLFLEALGFNARIVSRANRLTAKRGNSYFTLIESTKIILLREYSVEHKGFEYEKVEKIYKFKIVEEMGNIKVLDENERAVICLNNNHEILKIDSDLATKHHESVVFESKTEFLKYKEMEISKEPTLF